MDPLIIIILIIVLLTFIIVIYYLLSKDNNKDNNHRYPYRYPYRYPLPPIIGGCAGTRFGCCPDGRTSRFDAAGSNCPA